VWKKRRQMGKCRQTAGSGRGTHQCRLALCERRLLAASRDGSPHSAIPVEPRAWLSSSLSISTHTATARTVPQAGGIGSIRGPRRARRRLALQVTEVRSFRGVDPGTRRAQWTNLFFYRGGSRVASPPKPSYPELSDISRSSHGPCLAREDDVGGHAGVDEVSGVPRGRLVVVQPAAAA
jgi:hypothetical protein